MGTMYQRPLCSGSPGKMWSYVLLPSFFHDRSFGQFKIQRPLACSDFLCVDSCFSGDSPAGFLGTVGYLNKVVHAKQKLSDFLM